MILLRSFLSGHIRIKRTREYYDAGIGPNVPFGAIGVSPVVSQNFLTNTAVPSWMDVSATTGNRMLYDSTGKLTYAPNNMLTYSNTFSNAAWGKTNIAVTNANAVSDPFGGTQATTITASAGSAQILQTGTLGPAAQIGSIWIRRRTGSGTVTVIAPYAGGVTVTSTIADGLWHRITAIASVGSGYGYCGVTIATSGDAVDIYAAQVEAVTYQTTPSTYNATTTAAYYGPRFDYDPSTLAAKGLLIEESRANALTYSQDFSTNWVPSNSALTQPSNVRPDGNATSALLTRGATTGAEAMLRFTSSQAISTAYTLSVYAKQNTSGALLYVRNLAVDSTTGTGVVTFALDGTNTITAGSTYTGKASISSVGNGWYRCSIVGTTPASIGANLIDVGCSTNAGLVTGAASASIYLYGAQLEAGSFATSYIPTTTASVTRAADVIKLSGAALTALQGAAGTFLEEMTLEGNKAAAQYGAYGNTVSPLYWDSLVVKATNGTNVLSSAQTAVVGTAGRGGLAWNASGRAISYSASAAVTDANSFGTIGSTVYLGSNNGANSLNGWVRALSFYNQRLSNATLATKTTVGGPL